MFELNVGAVFQGWRCCFAALCQMLVLGRIVGGTGAPSPASARRPNPANLPACPDRSSRACGIAIFCLVIPWAAGQLSSSTAHLDLDLDIDLIFSYLSASLRVYFFTPATPCFLTLAETNEVSVNTEQHRQHFNLTAPTDPYRLRRPPSFIYT